MLFSFMCGHSHFGQEAGKMARSHTALKEEDEGGRRTEREVKRSYGSFLITFIILVEASRLAAVLSC